MIKTERGTVEIKGEISEILTDFEMTGRAMKEVLIREMGEEKAIENSEKSVEERTKEITERIAEEIKEGIRKMLKGEK